MDNRAVLEGLRGDGQGGVRDGLRGVQERKETPHPRVFQGAGRGDRGGDEGVQGGVREEIRALLLPFRDGGRGAVPAGGAEPVDAAGRGGRTGRVVGGGRGGAAGAGAGGEDGEPVVRETERETEFAGADDRRRKGGGGGAGGRRRRRAGGRGRGGVTARSPDGTPPGAGTTETIRRGIVFQGRVFREGLVGRDGRAGGDSPGLVRARQDAGREQGVGPGRIGRILRAQSGDVRGQPGRLREEHPGVSRESGDGDAGRFADDGGAHGHGMPGLRGGVAGGPGHPVELGTAGRRAVRSCPFAGQAKAVPAQLPTVCRSAGAVPDAGQAQPSHVRSGCRPDAEQSCSLAQRCPETPGGGRGIQGGVGHPAPTGVGQSCGVRSGCRQYAE